MIALPNDLPGITAPAPKRFRSGTHRTVAPAETLARVRLLMPIMGITRVANITGLDQIGIPVVMVCRPNARSLAVSQGKGLTLDAARASGLMESIEAYHAEHITLPLKLASYEELRYTQRVADVARLPRPASSPFHEHLPLLWIEGYDLLQQERVWVPYEMVHMNYTTSVRSGAGCFIASSNGLAAGNHLLEAISHGVCEVVERDALAHWNVLPGAARSRTRIAPETITDLDARVLLERFTRAGVAVGVWEITSDTGIPAFLCRAVDRADDPLRRLYSVSGSGCHPSRTVALLRALTEAAQSRLTMIAGSRDDVTHEEYIRLRDPDLSRQSRAQILGSGPVRDFAGGPDWEAETFEEDLTWEFEKLRGVGIERIIIVNLTRPDFGLPVVRVVIPGLEAITQTVDTAPGTRSPRNGGM